MAQRRPCEGKTELFFSEDAPAQAEAKAICGRCPSTHRVECASIALTSGAEHGIWAGMTAVELREAVDEQRRAG